MARVLALSSQVVRGHVGLSAIVPGLQRLGHEVLGLPTVLLSNHPGHPHVAGERVAPELLARMLDALAANGWLAEVDAVLTGYLPSVGHVELALEVVARVRAVRPAATYVCDPVLGDDPKGIYIDPAVAAAIRDRLVPTAALVTPNRFELAFLTGRPVSSIAEARIAAVSLPGTVLATSVPMQPPAQIGNLLVCGPEQQALTVVPRRAAVPHGTGDLMAALVLGFQLSGCAPPETLARATARIDALLDASAGSDELHLAGADALWRETAPWPLAPVHPSPSPPGG